MDAFPSIRLTLRNTTHNLIIPNVLAIEIDSYTYTTVYPSNHDLTHIIANHFSIRQATNPPSTAVIIHAR